LVPLEWVAFENDWKDINKEKSKLYGIFWLIEAEFSSPIFAFGKWGSAALSVPMGAGGGDSFWIITPV
jgi:hypothetical protein